MTQDQYVIRRKLNPKSGITSGVWSGGKYEVETSWVLDCWLYTFTHRHIGFGLYCLFYYLYKT